MARQGTIVTVKPDGFPLSVLQAKRQLRIEPEDTEEDDPSQHTYDRIVVVGHSLGGVIAYDILSFLWSANNLCLLQNKISKQKRGIRAHCQ